MVSPVPKGPFSFVFHTAATVTETWSCYPPNYNPLSLPTVHRKKTKSFLRLTWLCPLHFLLSFSLYISHPDLSLSLPHLASSSHRTFAHALPSVISLLYPNQGNPFISQLSYYFPRKAIPLHHMYAWRHVYSPMALISV